MICKDPIIVGPGEKAPAILHVNPLRLARRGKRALFVSERDIHVWTPDGWIRIPATYVTDFGSIPFLARMLTLGGLDPMGPGQLAFLTHDWPYAVGQPGRRARADDWLKYRLEMDGVDRFDRALIVWNVRQFGAAGYRRAPTWWESENFADPMTGAYPIAPPFAREEAYDGARWGLRPEPDWA